VGMQPEVEYLGYLIGRGTLKMLPDRIKMWTEIKTPPHRRNESGRYTPPLRKQVRMFLGATGFYRKFIRDYAEISAPLSDITKTSTNIEWGEEHEKAWKTIQKLMSVSPILTQPDPNKEFILDTDASGIGIGAALLQRNEEGTAMPIGYFSKKLNPTEKGYSTLEREALAILRGIEKFSQFLRGRRFVVITDHMNLEWLMSGVHLKDRLLDWAIKLREFEFEVRYREGKLNALADMLSRLPPEQLPAGKNVEIAMIMERGDRVKNDIFVKPLQRLIHPEPSIVLKGKICRVPRDFRGRLEIEETMKNLVIREKKEEKEKKNKKKNKNGEWRVMTEKEVEEEVMERKVKEKLRQVKERVKQLKAIKKAKRLERNSKETQKEERRVSMEKGKKVGDNKLIEFCVLGDGNDYYR